MRNMMIDEATLNDLQFSGYPELVATEEVILDIEKARRKRNVAVQEKSRSSESN